MVCTTKGHGLLLRGADGVHDGVRGLLKRQTGFNEVRSIMREAQRFASVVVEEPRIEDLK